jgi:hypothetical protein
MSIQWYETVKKYEKKITYLLDIDTSLSDQWKEAVDRLFIDSRQFDWKSFLRKTQKGKYRIRIDENIPFDVPEFNKVVNRIFQNVKYFSNKDLLHAVESSYEAWHRENGNIHWSLIKRYISPHKSNDWIFEHLRRKYDIRPDCVYSQFEDFQQVKKEFMETNTPLNYVYFDDAIYSGTQFNECWEALLSELTYDLSYDLLSEKYIGKQVNIFLICGYISENYLKIFKDGTGLFQESHKILNWTFISETSNTIHARGVWYRLNLFNLNFTIHMYFQETMPSKWRVLEENTADMDEETINAVSNILQMGSTLAFFEHKVPDQVSFPSLFARYIEPKLGYVLGETEPYKTLQVSPQAEQKQIFACAI